MLSLAGAVLTVMAWRDMVFRDAWLNLAAAVAAVIYATLGALIVRRADNLIGWFLLGEGTGLAVLSFGSAYSIAGIATHPGMLPAPELMGALAQWTFAPTVMGLAFMFILFPSGRLPSPRWRPVAPLGVLATALTMIAFVLRPGLVSLPAPGGVSLKFPNPFGVKSLGPALSRIPVGTINDLAIPFLVLLAAAFGSLAVRYRAGGRELRQQIKWVACAAAGGLISQLVAVLALTVTDGKQSPLSLIAYTAQPLIVFIGIPAAITIAILKYRLYEIDVIINRAVVYGLLSAALTTVYLGIVVGIGTLVGRRGGAILTIAAAVAIAVLFQPARRRAQLVANRIVYGERATPYQVLADFAQDMAGQLDPRVALDRMATVLARATGAVQVGIWVRVGTRLRPHVTWPPGSAPPQAVPLIDGTGLPAFDDAARSRAVRHGDELLGAITLHKPRNEPVTAAEDKLLTHLASQAGLLLRNVRLTAELQATIDDLRASRRRLVQAQDEERQRIERNLHDGAQQQLVALTVQLRLLEDAAEDPGEVRHLTAQIRDCLRAALDDLRALAHGIYPPLLADQGLGPALRAQAGRAPLPVRIDAHGIGRYPRDTEAAVYFCVLEALQNVAKYAQASQTAIALSCLDGQLEFTVTDDGTGFDAANPRHGTGLQGMADRLAAIGGTLRIRSEPWHGTTISGTLPVPDQGGREGTSLVRTTSERPEVTRAVREHGTEGWSAETLSAPNLQECP